MNLETVQKFFRSDAGRQVLALAEQSESSDREQLVADHAAAREEDGKIFLENSKREASARAKAEQAKAQSDAAARSLAEVRREGLAAKHTVELRLSAIENELRQMFPADVTAALERLQAEIDRLRKLADMQPAEKEAFRKLHSLQIELRNSDLYVMPIAELDAVVGRIDANLSHELVNA